MSDSTGEAPPPDERRRGRLGPLPIWAWVVIAIAALAIIALIAALLIWGDGKRNALATSTPSASSTSPISSATPSASVTPTPTPTPTAPGGVGQGTFDSDLSSFVSDALNSQNTAVLAQSGTFSNPIFVLAANSGLTQNMTPDDAVNAMGFMFTPSDPHPWDLALSDGTLAGYRAGPYGEYFPSGAIVARSHDGHVFSFIGHDSTITTMFMAASEDLLH